MKILMASSIMENSGVLSPRQSHRDWIPTEKSAVPQTKERDATPVLISGRQAAWKQNHMTPTLGAAIQQDNSPNQNKVEIKTISIKNQWDPSQIQNDSPIKQIIQPETGHRGVAE